MWLVTEMKVRVSNHLDKSERIQNINIVNRKPTVHVKFLLQIRPDVLLLRKLLNHWQKHVHQVVGAVSRNRIVDPQERGNRNAIERLQGKGQGVVVYKHRSVKIRSKIREVLYCRVQSRFCR